MTSKLTAALIGLAGLTAPWAAPLIAHADPWIAPNEINFSADNPSVTLDASNSDDLLVAYRAIAPETITAVGPDGATLTPENVSRGRARTTLDLRISQPGTTRVFTVTNGLAGTYTVDGKIYRLDTMRRPGGPGGPGGPQGGPDGQRPPGEGGPQGERPQGQGPQGQRAQGDGGQRAEGGPPAAPEGPPAGSPGGRPLPGVTDPAQIPAGATDIKLVQSSARSETFITRIAPTDWKPTGTGLELVPGDTAPTDVVVDEPARFKLALDGKPAANIEVEVSAANERYQTKPLIQKLKTDANGVVTIKWPTTGFYWFTAKAEAAGTIPNAVRRLQYTAVVVVQRP